MSEQTSYTVFLRLYVADRTTIPALNSALGPYFNLKLVYSFMEKKSLYYYLLNIVNVKILSLDS